MADDQATLGRFATEESSATGGEGSDDGSDGAGTAEQTVEAPTERAPADGSLVCPWCLAPEAAFEDGGLTGRRCGRCAATLPVEADWFRNRQVVARQPMYDTGEG